MGRRWLRRLGMIGAYALAWSLLTALGPVLWPVAALRDAIARTRFAAVRLLAMLWIFLAAELGGVTLAGLLWLRHIARPGRPHDAFLEDNYRLQRAWAGLLLWAAVRLLRLNLQVEGDEQAVPGPVVVLMRHTSVVDTILPVTLIGARHGLRLRYVLKRELQLDPCLDIVGARLPNCFVDRAGDTAREVELVGRLAEGLGPRDGVLIYPEGTRFTPARQQRARERLAERDPELHERALRLQHVLPPRPGGTLALLERALPQGADVVIVAHRGLESFVRMHDVLCGAFVGARVQVWIWRVPASQIPATREDRVRWLFDCWAEVDRRAAPDRKPSA